ncbi:MAG: glycosyltransferase family 4 protein [Maledivibacter sp.]|jgi:glycosyltransferase involved in cell wall biosynthesis|nr:glycosyltransferase family 4 protein [Maledivibacter sp.]
MKNEVCIVSPEIIGPHKNGGIGTQTYYLAQVLGESDYKTTVLFTGVCENKNASYWYEYFRKLNIEYVQIDNLKKNNLSIYGENWFEDRSKLVYSFLKKRNFDYIHFQDWEANGFHTIQAKYRSNEFDNTLITVTMHSSMEWVKQAMNWVDGGPVIDPKLEWCERYCCKYCDLLISPSQYMFKWAIENGWELAENKKVISNCFEKLIKITSNENRDLKHLIFFGRLETRKGLELLCDAILEVIQDHPKSIKRVSFVGKNGVVNDVSGDRYISNKFRGKGLNYNIYSDFDSFQALEYLKQQNGVIIMPSLMENYPYTVVESIENDMLFIASNVGGIPELVDENVLFEVNVKSLVDKILHLEEIFNRKINHKYSKVIAREGWLAIHR